MSTAHLFSSSAADAVDQQIVDLLTGKNGGPMGLRPSAEEMAVLRAIRYHRGAKNAISIRDLQAKIDLSEREIKQIVRTLRVAFRLPIGSSKSATAGGYFIVVSIEDQEIAASGPLAQIRAEVEVLRLITSPERTKELLGQIQLEVK